MIAASLIENLLTQALETISQTDSKDIFSVGLTVKPSNQIYIFVDSMDGVTIEDCIRISRHIEHNLDRETEDFELHVSSAGLDLPFRVVKQYQKNIGREVKVVMKDGEVVRGELLQAGDESFEVQPILTSPKKARSKEVIPQESVKILYQDCKETKLIISFK